METRRYNEVYMIIVVIGKCASGKTTCANYLKNTYGFTIFEIGDYVRNQYALCHREKILLDYVDSLFKKGKLSCFVKEALNDSKSQRNDNIAFVGIRTFEELELIRKEYQDLVLLNIVCSEKNRKKRYDKQKSDAVSLTLRTNTENEWNKAGFSELADYELNNDSTKEELYNSIDNILLFGGIK